MSHDYVCRWSRFCAKDPLPNKDPAPKLVILLLSLADSRLGVSKGVGGGGRIRQHVWFLWVSRSEALEVVALQGILNMTLGVGKTLQSMV